MLFPANMPNIPDLLKMRKVQDGLLICAVVLLGVTSFGLGRLSVEREQGVLLCEGENTPLLPEQKEMTASVVQALSPQRAQEKTTTQATPTPSPVQGAYVASKTGKAYYAPWCGGVERIKEENKVWFASKEEAEARGYTPSKNCKGI